MENIHDKKITILIVDDSPDSIALLSSILKDTYRIKVALTGDKALEIVSSTDSLPDLILLDVMMPGLDGYETCQRLKDNSLTAGIPVLFLTAKTGEDDRQKALSFGAEDCIAKPPSPEILRARIRTLLSGGGGA